MATGAIVVGAMGRAAPRIDVLARVSSHIWLLAADSVEEWVLAADSVDEEYDIFTEMAEGRRASSRKTPETERSLLNDDVRW